MPQAIFGLTPLRFDWAQLTFKPSEDDVPPINVRVDTPYGVIVLTHDSQSGYTLQLPAGVNLQQDVSAPSVTVQEDSTLNQAALSTEDWDRLKLLGWEKNAAEAQALYVSVARQRLYLIQNCKILWTAPIATAKNGTGQIVNSMQTPLGWHRISEKYGDDAPWGQVFRSRAATAKVWDGQENIEEGLVLTRILWLEGLEDGLNKGKNSTGETVDSKQRYIYIHGTNKEHCIGMPMSDGCINMYNDDVIKLYDIIPLGSPVLISQE